MKNKFDTSIDRKYFEKIKETLESGSWESIVNKNTVEHCKTQENKCNLKLITDVTSKESKSTLLLKENILKEDSSVSFSPFDIRFSVNQEFCLDSQLKTFSKTDCVIRNKSRKSFISQDFRYDLTIVNENIEGVVKTKYEIEIELLVTKNTITWKTCYINDFLECKVYDLVNIVEPIEREKFKLKLIKK